MRNAKRKVAACGVAAALGSGIAVVGGIAAPETAHASVTKICRVWNNNTLFAKYQVTKYHSGSRHSISIRPLHYHQSSHFYIKPSMYSYERSEHDYGFRRWAGDRWDTQRSYENVPIHSVVVTVKLTSKKTGAITLRTCSTGF